MCRCDAARVLTPRVHNENRDEKLGVMCCPAVDAPCACERHGRSDACASAAEELAAVAAAAPARAGVGILLCELSRLIVDTVVREPAGGTVGADRSTDGLDHAQHSSSRIPLRSKQEAPLRCVVVLSQRARTRVGRTLATYGPHRSERRKSVRRT